MATSRTGAGWLQGLGGALAAPPLGDPQALLTRHVLCESGPPGQWQDTGPASCLHTIGACRVQAGQGHWLARCLSMGAGGPSPQPCEERTCTPLTAEGRAGQEGPLGAQRAGRGLQARGGLLSGGPRGALGEVRVPPKLPCLRRKGCLVCSLHPPIGGWGGLDIDMTKGAQRDCTDPSEGPSGAGHRWDKQRATQSEE